MNKAWYVVAGIFFALAASVFFTGLYLNYPVLGGSSQSSFGANFLGFTATAIISLAMFIAAKRA